MDTQMSEQGSSKKGLILVIVIVIIVAVVGWWWISKNKSAPAEEQTAVEESQFTEESINKDLESVNTGDLEKEFQDIDADLNNL